MEVLVLWLLTVLGVQNIALILLISDEDPLNRKIPSSVNPVIPIY